MQPRRGISVLYDVSADIGEQTELGGDRPSDLARLEQARQAWNNELRAPVFPGPRPNARKAKAAKKKQAGF